MQNPPCRHSREGGNPVLKQFPRSGQSSIYGVASLREDSLIAWIPAFAGMTVALWHLS
jgi:hypothetical protein